MSDLTTGWRKRQIALAEQAETWNADGDKCEVDLEKFAALVEAAVRADEREACANLCEQHGYEHYCGNVTDKLAETIRARGQV